MDSEDKIHDHLEVMSQCDHDVLLKNEEQFKPMYLPVSLLKAITKNFSDGLQIGSGGFALVYKGLLKRGGTVAVKKLMNTISMDDNEFQKEVSCLMRVRHRNIVRFLGYCADTQSKMRDYKGKLILADERERLLCFEYLPNGSLEKYVDDASGGLEWNKRYKIIKGICEALQYLHENNIVHLDLKPANILLNDNMVPKISDFGLSRCFGEMQSRTMTSKLVGSIGYLAPEFFNGEITRKLDIYSLGVIIAEMLTGKQGHSSVENVLECWKKRFGESPNTDMLLEQVRVCAKIRMSCGNLDPAMRPDIQQITAILNEPSDSDDFSEVRSLMEKQIHSFSGSHGSGLLAPQVMPLELLREITNDFSEKQRIGSGTFGTVYKGDLDGKEVVVKLFHSISQRLDYEEDFMQEFENLSRLNHVNIVQLLGYYYEIKRVYIEYEGKHALADKIDRALCFDYMHNGSLQKHLHDESGGLDWQTRYKIIKGTCEGLKYLHKGLENPMFHLDLKPGNILLDKNMVPKLADFCLSKLVSDNQTQATSSFLGTIGYCPPEHIDRYCFSDKFDIFSLGVIMIEIITGAKGHDKVVEMGSQGFIDHVQENWRKRIHRATPGCTSPNCECQQVKRCIEIALECVQPDRTQRPDIEDITSRLNKTENNTEESALTSSSQNQT